MPQGHQQEGWDMSTSIASLTPYKQANATRSSARGTAYVNWHHLLPTSRQMPQDRQQEGLHMSTSITYFLQAGKCHEAINKRAGTCQIASLHLLPTSRQIPQGHQQEGLHMSTRLTYILRGCECTIPSAKTAHIWQPTSLTAYKQANATRPSVRWPAHVNQHYLLSTNRQMPQSHQQKGLHMSTRMTYILRASKCHETISKRASI